MPDIWRPSNKWMQRFRKALDEAFDEPSMELLTTDYFSSSRAFSRVSPPGFHKTHEYRLFELINQARMNDWLPDLVAAARERRPKNAVIGDLAEELGFTLIGPRLDNPTGHTLEDLIQANAEFINPAVFYELLPRLEGQVCWVDVPGGGGTGFLVGPDLVLTNQHVIQRVVSGEARSQDVRCWFDYRQPLDGTELAEKKQTMAELAERWLVDSRAPSPYDWNPAQGDALSSETDSALIRLADPLGDLPVGGMTADQEAEPRGWLDASVEPRSLSAGNQVFLLQHPQGKPLRLTIGTVTGFNSAGTRLRYNANSLDGSSGSPCLNADLRLVGLHHAHDPGYPRAWNQAIPFGLIQAGWRERGVTVP